MKDKKVGDKIVFDYDVYDIEYNVEMVYDHTDTLAGIIKEVIPSDRGGYTKYKVKLTGLINIEHKSDYSYYLGSDEHTLEVSDDKVYRAGGLHDAIYQGMCPRPTIYQIERIIKMYDQSKDISVNMDNISHNWYKYGLEKFGLYDEEEFGIVKPIEASNESPIEDKKKFWEDFKNKVLAGIK
jgi:hypothetical protein